MIIHLFCNVSERSSLFSEIYDSSPAFCLLIDSAVIIFIKVFEICVGGKYFQNH